MCECEKCSHDHNISRLIVLLLASHLAHAPDSRNRLTCASSPPTELQFDDGNEDDDDDDDDDEEGDSVDGGVKTVAVAAADFFLNGNFDCGADDEDSNDEDSNDDDDDADEKANAG